MQLARRFRALLAPPALADAETARVAATVQHAALIYGAISLIWTLVWLVWLPEPGPHAAAGVLMAAGVLAPLALARAGRVRTAAIALVSAVWLVTTGTLVGVGGIDTPTFSTYAIAILIAGLLLGGRAAAAVALASVIAGGALAALEGAGLLPPPVLRHTLLTIWWVETVLFLAAGGTLWIALAQQRSAQSALARSEARLRLAVDAARLRVWEVDPWREHVVSSGYPLPGLSSMEEAPLERFVERIHPEDRLRLEEAYRALVERGAALDDEARVRGSDERWHWVAIRARPERDDEDRLARAVFAVQDVTDRKEAEALGERLRRALDQSSEGVLLLDAEMRTLYANPSFESLLGLEIAPFEGVPAERLAETSARRSALFDAAREQVLAGEPWRDRYEIEAPDGSRAVRDAAASPVRDASGGLVGYVLLIRDVTREVRLEENLRRAEKLEAVGQLAGGVAHDFNNLLTVIIGFLEVLQTEARDAPHLQEPLQHIRDASERASELTRQLLAYGRRQVTWPRVLDVGALVDDTQPLLRGLLPESVAIRWERPADAAPVEADPGQLQEVLLNLASNAGDAMPEGGELEVRVVPEELDRPEASASGLLPPGPYVRLELRDTGVGMDAATRERAFEPFFSTKEPGRGTGLGLASAYGVVDQLGGAIAIESAPGAGTTCRIHLPRADAVPAQPAERPGRAPTGACVLVVEDDAAVRRLVCATLRREGLDVLEARDGAEALERVAERAAPVDLLVTDVVMPRLSGARLAERLVELWPALRVLFVSGYPRAELTEGAAPSGVPILQKPFLPETLLHHVRQALAEASAYGGGDGAA